MKLGSAMTSITATLLLSAPAVFAHPGHVHGPGPAHGFSWIDLALFLAATIVAPAAALLFVRLRGRRSR